MNILLFILSESLLEGEEKVKRAQITSDISDVNDDETIIKKKPTAKNTVKPKLTLETSGIYICYRFKNL